MAANDEEAHDAESFIEEVDLDSGTASVVPDAEFPKQFKELAPVFKRWGFTEEARLDAFLERMQAERPAEVERFCNLMNEKESALRDWLRESGTPKCPITSANANIIGTLKAYSLVRPIPPDIRANYERRKEEHQRIKKRDSDIEAGIAQFRTGNFSVAVERLSPWGDELSESQQKMLDIAMKKIQAE